MENWLAQKSICSNDRSCCIGGMVLFFTINVKDQSNAGFPLAQYVQQIYFHKR
jgi:hypothetical protein